MQFIFSLIMFLVYSLASFGEHEIKIAFEPDYNYALNRHDRLSYRTNFSKFDQLYFQVDLGISPFFDKNTGAQNAPLMEIGSTYIIKKSTFHQFAASLSSGIQLGKTRSQYPTQLRASYVFQSKDIKHYATEGWYKYFLFSPNLNIAYNLISVGPSKQASLSKHQTSVALNGDFEFALFLHGFYKKIAAHRFGYRPSLIFTHNELKMPSNVQIISDKPMNNFGFNFAHEFFYRFVVTNKFFIKLGITKDPLSAPPIVSGLMFEFSYTI